MRPVRTLAAYAAAATCGIVLLGACGDSGTTEPPREPGTLQLSESAVAVDDGQFVTLTASLLDQHGQAFQQPPAGQSITWSVEDGETAAIEPGDAWNQARIEGRFPGITNVSASIAGLSASAEVTVAVRATVLQAIGGDEQEGRTGDLLGDSVRVRVTDRHGEGVGGVTVEFNVVGGGGSVSPASATTGADGGAATAWTLGTEAGDNTLEARVSGLDGSPASFTATAHAEEPLGNVAGTVTAENGVTPIQGATVTLQTSGTQAAGMIRFSIAAPQDAPSTTTDLEGNFLLEGVPAGPQTVVARRGVFEATIDVDVAPGATVTAPTLALQPAGKLAYVEGDFDSIEEIVAGTLGSDVEQISASDLADPAITAQYRIIFVNCGSDIPFWEQGVVDNLHQYVESGGVLYVSDLEIGLVMALFPQDVRDIGDGDQQTLQASVTDAALEAFTGRDQVEIVYDFDGWAALADVSEAPTVLLRGDYDDADGRIEDGPLAIMLEAGDGQVVFTTFHNSAAATPDQIAVLSYFVYGVGGGDLAPAPMPVLRQTTPAQVSPDMAERHRQHRHGLRQR